MAVGKISDVAAASCGKVKDVAAGSLSKVLDVAYSSGEAAHSDVVGSELVRMPKTGLLVRLATLIAQQTERLHLQTLAAMTRVCG